MRSGIEMAETRGKMDWMKNSNFFINFPCRLPNLAPKACAKMKTIRR